MLCFESLMWKCISHEEFTGHGGTSIPHSSLLQIIQHRGKKTLCFRKLNIFTNQMGNKWIFTLIFLSAVAHKGLSSAFMYKFQVTNLCHERLEHPAVHMWPFLTSVVPDFSLPLPSVSLLLSLQKQNLKAFWNVAFSQVTSQGWETLVNTAKSYHFTTEFSVIPLQAMLPVNREVVGVLLDRRL